ncbi:MAG: YceI family protein [Betaproteobacteria bacterium]|nr:YceI family protein [Betaproteobacteria bacterium]
MKTILSILLGISLLVSCSTPTGREAGRPPDTLQQRPSLEARTVLHVDPHQSLITILVHRGGMLARLGHDHVVASHDVQGFVVAQTGYAELTIPLGLLTVDEPALRERAGLEAEVPQDAVEGTRLNMQTKVLQVDQFPTVQIQIFRPDPAGSALRVSISMHGVTRVKETQAAIQSRSEGEVIVTGSMTLNQSDFGMVPLSVLGGSLQVRDAVEVHYSIVATLP